LQAAQATHAAFQLALTHPDEVRRWHDESNCVVLLCVPDEDALLDELDVIAEAGAPYAVVVEPDIGDEHTAVAIAPSGFSRRFANLPLMGKELPMGV
jgi:Peptidyl-tRNA hydrolase PTH2